MKKQIITILEPAGEKTWNQKGFSISLEHEPLKYLAVLWSNAQSYDWYLHCENHSGTPFTEEEKTALFTELSYVIDKDNVITSSGGVTPGGISALKNLTNYGFSIIGKRSGDDIYWSEPLINIEKFNNWLQHADPEDYKVIDPLQPLTIENCKPVIKVLIKQ